MKNDQTLTHQESPRSTLDKRLEDTGWGLFLVMIGCLMLVPTNLVPQGTWLIATGLILLVINGIRYLNGIRMSSFTFILGIFTLIAGLGDFFNLKLPLFAIFLIFIGISIILKPLLTKGH